VAELAEREAPLPSFRKKKGREGLKTLIEKRGREKKCACRPAKGKSGREEETKKRTSVVARSWSGVKRWTLGGGREKEDLRWGRVHSNFKEEVPWIFLQKGEGMLGICQLAAALLKFVKQGRNSIATCCAV